MKLSSVSALATVAILATAPDASHASTNRLAEMREFVHVLLAERDPAAAYERYAAPDMRQDNPALGHDRESTISAMHSLLSMPGSQFRIQDVIVDGDVSVVRYFGMISPGHPGAEVVEFFRWKGSRIVEQWDVFQSNVTRPEDHHD